MATVLSIATFLAERGNHDTDSQGSYGGRVIVVDMVTSEVKDFRTAYVKYLQEKIFYLEREIAILQTKLETKQEPYYFKKIFIFKSLVFGIVFNFDYKKRYWKSNLNKEEIKYRLNWVTIMVDGSKCYAPVESLGRVDG